MKNIAIILVILTTTSLAFTMPVQANGDTTINVYIVTDGNITASFNTTVNGTVNYWLNGTEVLGEFADLWDALAGAENEIDELQKGVSSNFRLAKGAHILALQNEEELDEHNQTLLVHYNAINDTYTRSYLLKDKVVIFEGHYLDFVNATNHTFNEQQAKIDTLNVQLDDTNSLLALIKNTLIGVGGVGVLISAVYFVNRRYPIKDIFNGNFKFKNDKPKFHSKMITKIGKSNSLNKKLRAIKRTRIRRRIRRRIKRKEIKRKKIRRNPEKSPLKFLSINRKTPFLQNGDLH